MHNIHIPHVFLFVSRCNFLFGCALWKTIDQRQGCICRDRVFSWFDGSFFAHFTIITSIDWLHNPLQFVWCNLCCDHNMLWLVLYACCVWYLWYAKYFVVYWIHIYLHSQSYYWRLIYIYIHCCLHWLFFWKI